MKINDLRNRVEHGSINKNILAEQIKSLRLSLGYTQEEFGKKFNPIASKSIVSRWEKGTSIPNAPRLQKISELSNKSVMELTTGISEDEIADTGRRLLKLLEKLQQSNSEILTEAIESVDTEEQSLEYIYAITYAIRLANKFKGSENYRALQSLAGVLGGLLQESNEDPEYHKELNLKFGILLDRMNESK